MFKTMKWAAALLLATQVSGAFAVTGMRFISTAGDYIGQGRTETYLASSSTITVGSISDSAVEVRVSNAEHWWYLDFAGPLGEKLARGAYAEAARYPFYSPLGAGLSVSGDGRGCNTLLGWFRVREYQRDDSGAVTALAIDFLQNCEVTGPPLYGAVRFNSQLPLAVPDTVAIAGTDQGATAGSTVVLNGAQSFSRKSSPLSYHWQQLDGPVVTLSSTEAASPQFTAPDVGLAGDTLRFRLTVVDGQGKSSQDDVLVAVSSTQAPRTQISFHGDPGDYITGGRSYSYDTHNAALTFTRNYDGGVSASISGDTWWSFDSASPQGTVYGKGTYANAQRFPFQEATAPGLSLDGDGRGCNTLTGSFTVHQAQFDATGEPKTLDISFEQHCEGGTPAAYGEVLLNAVPYATLAKQLRAARKRFPSD